MAKQETYDASSISVLKDWKLSEETGNVYWKRLKKRIEPFNI